MKNLKQTIIRCAWVNKYFLLICNHSAQYVINSESIFKWNLAKLKAAMTLSSVYGNSLRNYGPSTSSASSRFSTSCRYDGKTYDSYSSSRQYNRPLRENVVSAKNDSHVQQQPHPIHNKSDQNGEMQPSHELKHKIDKEVGYFDRSAIGFSKYLLVSNRYNTGT